jgi:pre-60S factor REI1
MDAAVCQACRAPFTSPEAQREHYKGEWHRFNLKRKMVKLPPVTETQFAAHEARERVTSSKNASTDSSSLQCRVCRGKKFGTQATFDQHVKSKQHQKNAAKRRSEATSGKDENVTVASADDITPGSTESGSPALASHPASAQSDADLDESSTPIVVPKKSGGSQRSVDGVPTLLTGVGADGVVADVDDEEEIERLIIERIRTAPRLPLETCLFCPHTAEGMGENFEHMADKHSFFVPDIERLSDAEGLLRYLGEKVAIGFECLECNGRGRAFTSLEGVRDHMVEKCHTKLDWFGNEAEYEDFYEWEETDAPFKDIEPGVKLMLANGKELGHRDLTRYYKQNYRPGDDSQAIIAAKAQQHATPTSRRDARLQAHLAGRYKALGWGGQSGALANVSPAVRREMASRFLRATKAEHRYRQNEYMHIGINNSNLPKHIRDPTKCLW